MLAKCRETCLNHPVMTSFMIFISDILLNQPGLLSTELVGSAIIVVEGAIFVLSAIGYTGEMFVNKNTFTEILFLTNNPLLGLNGE